MVSSYDYYILLNINESYLNNQFPMSAVPPDIINEESSADIAVQEGEDAILTCHATGNPMPRIIWRREDNEAISLRKTGTRELIKGKFNDQTVFFLL